MKSYNALSRKPTQKPKTPKTNLIESANLILSCTLGRARLPWIFAMQSSGYCYCYYYYYYTTMLLLTLLQLVALFNYIHTTRSMVHMYLSQTSRDDNCLTTHRLTSSEEALGSCRALINPGIGNVSNPKPPSSTR